MTHNEPPDLDLQCLPLGFDFSIQYSLALVFFENLQMEILSSRALNTYNLVNVQPRQHTWVASHAKRPHRKERDLESHAYTVDSRYLEDEGTR